VSLLKVCTGSSYVCSHAVGSADLSSGVAVTHSSFCKQNWVVINHSDSWCKLGKGKNHRQDHVGKWNVNCQVFGFVSHSDNIYGIILGFSSRLPIILDIVLTQCVGIARTTVAWGSGEGYTLSVSFYKTQKSSNTAGGCPDCCVLFVRHNITHDSHNFA